MALFENFWDYLIPGLTLGAVYAVIAIGYTLVYGVLQLINFAHSEVFMAGGFGGLLVLSALMGDAQPSGAASVLFVVLGIAAGALAGGGTAYALERVAYRPLRRRGAPRLIFLISAVGASFFLYNLAGRLFGRNPVPIPALYENGVLFTVFGTPVRITQVLMLGAAIVMMIVLDLVVNRTRMGAGIRAVAQDSETASLMGVNIDSVIARTFIIGGLLGGVAGFLFGMFSTVTYTMGFLPGIKAFAAAVLGGIGNIRGAMLGGMLLGIVENLSAPVFGTAWVDVTAFLVLVLVLMFRPTGILGERLGRSA
ncbi:branched-chain amino acid ABC transporter permease [Allostreptomyces psammosilenae]|uniref:Branched-chain amino acid transport system permease protein n=1 Tax=Allostreptomyces psammosilenae TaxID=1892865 RepID=A0A852ZYB1_9ACTN|nr:branched-chain amino acid ABC transporter permease [Allostreptomyces psammosilenae]NYI07159.1 branched-chain amino acid transport system permease protein [Allostreptomyces psammosilenae]